jgi:hypothetical protein
MFATNDKRIAPIWPGIDFLLGLHLLLNKLKMHQVFCDERHEQILIWLGHRSIGKPETEHVSHIWIPGRKEATIDVFCHFACLLFVTSDPDVPRQCYEAVLDADDTGFTDNACLIACRSAWDWSVWGVRL